MSHWRGGLPSGVTEKRASRLVFERARLGLLVPAALTLALGGCAATGATGELEEPAGKTPALDSALVLSEPERQRAVALAAEARREMPVPETTVPGAVFTEEVVTAVGLYPPTDDTDRRRLASVISFDYRTGTAYSVILDLSSERTVRAEVIPASSAPVADSELARARALLAEDSKEYRALFASPEHGYDLGTFVSTGAVGDELAGHRILLIRPVYFQPAPDAPIALVDLTTNRVLQYED